MVLNGKLSQEYLVNAGVPQGTINVKMDGSVLEEKPSFKMIGLTFCSKLDWSSYITSIAKTASKENCSTDLFYEVSFS